MKTAIDWILLALGAALMATGAWWMWTGWDLVQIERGWASLIAGAVMLSGGFVVVAVAWAIVRLRPQPVRRPPDLAHEEDGDSLPVEPDRQAARVSAGVAAAAGAVATALATHELATHESAASQDASRQDADAAHDEDGWRNDPTKRDDHAAFDRVASEEIAQEAAAALDVPPPPPPQKRPSVFDLLQPAAEKPAPVVAEAHRDFADLPPQTPAEASFETPAPKVEPPPPPPPRDPFDELAWEFPALAGDHVPSRDDEIAANRDAPPHEAAQPEPAPVAATPVAPPPASDEADWLDETARALDRELGRSAVPPSPPAEEPPAPAPHEPAPLAAEPAVIGRYASGDTNYIMFADGSIEAQTPDGAMRFASLVELRRFVEQRG